MDRENKEKQMIYEWACRYYSEERAGSIFPKMDGKADSYFIKRKDYEYYLNEYGFQSLPQLKDKLTALWKEEAYMDGVMKPVLASVFKSRSDISTSDAKSRSDRESETEELPQYIYNF